MSDATESWINEQLNLAWERDIADPRLKGKLERVVDLKIARMIYEVAFTSGAVVAIDKARELYRA